MKLFKSVKSIFIKEANTVKSINSKMEEYNKGYKTGMALINNINITDNINSKITKEYNRFCKKSDKPSFLCGYFKAINTAILLQSDSTYEPIEVKLKGNPKTIPFSCNQTKKSYTLSESSNKTNLRSLL